MQVKKKKQLTPDYTSVKINDNNRHCLNTIKAVTQFRLNQTTSLMLKNIPYKAVRTM